MFLDYKVTSEYFRMLVIVTMWWDDRQYKLSCIFPPIFLTIFYDHNDTTFQNKVRPLVLCVLDF